MIKEVKEGTMALSPQIGNSSEEIETTKKM